jgi:elongation factor Ts
VADFARHVAENGEVDGEVAGAELSGQRLLQTDETLGDRLAAAIAKIGENLVIRRAARFGAEGEGLVASYVHANDRIGVLLELAGSREAAEAVAKDLTLHIAAERPRYLSREEVDASDLEREREILTNKALNEGKPQNIVDKIVAGQLAKFYEENVLLEQKFVKDNSVTVRSLLKDGVSLRRFARFEIGA